MPRKSIRKRFCPIPRKRLKKDIMVNSTGMLLSLEADSVSSAGLEAHMQPSDPLTIQDLGHDYCSVSQPEDNHQQSMSRQEHASFSEVPPAAAKCVTFLLDAVVQVNQKKTSELHIGCLNITNSSSLTVTANALSIPNEGSTPITHFPGQATPESRFIVSPSSVVSLLLRKIPNFWTASSDSNGFYLQYFSRDNARVVQRTIFVPFSGALEVYVHGKLLPPDVHPIYKLLRDIPVSRTNENECAESLLKFLNALRSYEICVGAFVTKYATEWKREADCFIDDNAFHEKRYKQTCRSINCEYIVPPSKKTCNYCRIVLHRFTRRKLSSNSGAPSKFKPFKLCTDAEKQAKFNRQSQVIDSLARQNKRLKMRLEQVTENSAPADELDQETQDAVESVDLEGPNKESDI